MSRGNPHVLGDLGQVYVLAFEGVLGVAVEVEYAAGEAEMAEADVE